MSAKPVGPALVGAFCGTSEAASGAGFYSTCGLGCAREELEKEWTLLDFPLLMA